MTTGNAQLGLFQDTREQLEADAAERLVQQSTGIAATLDAADKANTPTKEPLQKGLAFLADSGLDNNPSKPLRDGNEETFCQLVVDGVEAYIAYIRAGHPNCTRKSATQQASRWGGNPRIRERLRYLIKIKKAEALPEERPDEMTRTEMVKELSKAARSSVNMSDRVAAMKLLQQIRDQGQGNRKNIPDPAFLMDYLKRAHSAGKDPIQLAQEALDEIPVDESTLADAAEVLDGQEGGPDAQE